jgi:DNA-binding IclR family transcriptional regulator
MSSSQVKSATRVLDVLETLASNAQPTPTMAIARECGIPKSSAHHLLNVLRERNYVVYYEREHAWGLGVKSFEVGSTYLRRTPLQRLGRPVLEEVCVEIEETCHLAILHGADVLYLDKEQPAGHGPSLVTDIGVRLPAHLTAVGWAILSRLSEAQVRAVFGSSPMVNRTGAGPVDLDSLLADLGATRQRGYAFDDQMVTPGICCLAAPVFSHESLPVAAIGISYLAAKSDDLLVSGYAKVVSGAAQELSVKLGWQGQAEPGRSAA